MQILFTIIVFIVIFTIIVLVHEAGHFLAARKVGIRVEEFGLGFPPRALKLFRDKKGTLFSLNWIPFGGFVKMYGEDSVDPKLTAEKNSFIGKTKWQRTVVICAGVFMNFLLGVLLLTTVFTIGSEPFILSHEDFDRHVALGNIVSEDGVLIQNVLKESVAEKTGFLAGDVILTVNGEKVSSGEEVVAITQNFKKKKLQYHLMRDKKEFLLEAVIPDEGRIGIDIASVPLIKEIKKIKLPVHEAFVESVKEAGRLSWTTVVMLGDVIKGLISKFHLSDNIAGPIGIAQMTHNVSQQGLTALMKFMALISVSLATINILPFPALDGGRFLFIVFEFFRGKRANAKWEAVIHSIGFIFLMILIAAITYKDILRLIFG